VILYIAYVRGLWVYSILPKVDHGGIRVLRTLDEITKAYREQSSIPLVLHSREKEDVIPSLRWVELESLSLRASPGLNPKQEFDNISWLRTYQLWFVWSMERRKQKAALSTGKEVAYNALG